MPSWDGGEDSCRGVAFFGCPFLDGASTVLFFYKKCNQSLTKILLKPYRMLTEVLLKSYQSLILLGLIVMLSVGFFAGI